MSDGMSAERLAGTKELATIWASPAGYEIDMMRCHAIQELLAEVARLHTWAGLMSLLDQHYPPDTFDGSSGDPGPRIIALTREVGRLRDLNAELSETLDVRHDETQQLRARLDEIGETSTGFAVRSKGGEAFCATPQGALRIAWDWNRIRADGPWSAKQRVVGQWREVPDA